MKPSEATNVDNAQGIGSGEQRARDVGGALARDGVAERLDIAKPQVTRIWGRGVVEDEIADEPELDDESDNFVGAATTEAKQKELNRLKEFGVDEPVEQAEGLPWVTDGGDIDNRGVGEE